MTVPNSACSILATVSSEVGTDADKSRKCGTSLSHFCTDRHLSGFFHGGFHHLFKSYICQAMLKCCFSCVIMIVKMALVRAFKADIDRCEQTLLS